MVKREKVKTPKKNSKENMESVDNISDGIEKLIETIKESSKIQECSSAVMIYFTVILATLAILSMWSTIYTISIVAFLITFLGSIPIALAVAFFTIKPKKKVKSKKTKKNSEIMKYAISIVIPIIISLLIFVFSLQNSINLSEKTLSDTFWLTSPVTMFVNDTANETEGRWYINVTNTHPSKDTGAIYLYRIEMDPNKPHMFNETGLEPGESMMFTLDFGSDKKSVDFIGKTFPYGFTFIVPSSKMHYVNEHISITFKIACDNCPSHGIIRRLPGFSVSEFIATLTVLGASKVEIPVYSWTDYQLEDVLAE